MFWLGLAQIGLALVEYLKAQDWSEFENINWTALVLGALTIVFRWLTSEPITSISPRFDKLRPNVLKKVKKANGGR